MEHFRKKKVLKLCKGLIERMKGGRESKHSKTCTDGWKINNNYELF